MAHIFTSERVQTPAAATPASKAAPDARLETLQAQADASTATDKIAQLQAKASVQRMEEEDLMQGKFETPVQRMEEEDLMQGKFKETVQRQSNGLPEGLASGVESLSGVSMGDVQVHRNSAKPAQMNAHAYAQGADIHLASGQEKHLPHEAWHVAQQKQGRVQATTQLAGVGVNDDAALESEADVMGAKAAQLMPDDRV